MTEDLLTVRSKTKNMSPTRKKRLSAQWCESGLSPLKYMDQVWLASLFLFLKGTFTQTQTTHAAEASLLVLDWRDSPRLYSTREEKFTTLPDWIKFQTFTVPGRFACECAERSNQWVALFPTSWCHHHRGQAVVAFGGHPELYDPTYILLCMTEIKCSGEETGLLAKAKVSAVCLQLLVVM